jgi:hypothetical protein
MMKPASALFFLKKSLYETFSQIVYTFDLIGS